MPRLPLRRALPTAAAVAALALTLTAQTTAPLDRVIVHAAKPYDQIAASIETAGGRVRHRYAYLDLIAADVPRASLESLRAVAGVSGIAKDVIVPAPRNMAARRADPALTPTGAGQSLQSASVEGIAPASLSGFAAANPDSYLINNAVMNASQLHGAGITGAGVVVAVIDSGIRPQFPHLSLDGSVIGGEDFVGDGLGFSNVANSGHGTFVAGMISANVLFGFDGASLFARSAAAYCPSCVIASGTTTFVPMLGSAPAASIYALRVFPPEGGSPTSRILEAVERVIELRERFDAGLPGGLNVQICNMSLGGSTLFAGRDLFDMAVDALLERGIVLVTSAGNAGPSSLTGGSPGTAFEALTVGAASQALNERIVSDLQFGFGVGGLFPAGRWSADRLLQLARADGGRPAGSRRRRRRRLGVRPGLRRDSRVDQLRERHQLLDAVGRRRGRAAPAGAPGRDGAADPQRHRDVGEP